MFFFIAISIYDFGVVGEDFSYFKCEFICVISMSYCYMLFDDWYQRADL